MNWRTLQSRGVRGAAPERGELAEPGTTGRLKMRAETDEHGVLEHTGDFVYVGVVRGLHAFAPTHPTPVLFLKRDQITRFDR